MAGSHQEDDRPAPRQARLEELAGRAAELVKRAVLTDGAMPDRHRGYLSGPHSSMPTPLRDAAESYNTEGAQAEARRATRFRPTPADVERWPVVMSWLAWLRDESPDGRRDVEIIVRRAFGRPRWRLAQRYGRSEETIRRWQGAAIARLVNRFSKEIAAMSDTNR